MKKNTAMTATELAAKLGLSRGTIGAVLRGQCAKYQIPEVTAKRVLDAARKYNYVPNLAAQTLRRQRTNTIAVIVGGFTFDWAAGVLKGLTPVLETRGMTSIFTAHQGSPERQERELVAAMSRRDAGVICQPLDGQAAVYQRVLDAGIPLVFLGDYPTDLLKVSRVVWDAGEAARAAVAHLVSLGRQRIGYIGHDTPLVMHRKRFEGYKTALREASLKVDPRWIVQAPTTLATHDQIFQAYMPQLFRAGCEHPDALMMMNDGLAIPGIDELESRGYRVPQDVAVAGMGDLPMAGYRGISLTTVVEPVEKLGAAAAQVVLELIDTPSSPAIHRVIASSEVKVRRSSAG